MAIALRQYLAPGAAVVGIVWTTYAAFVIAMWGPFGPFNGMSYETGFALQSETSSIAQGFLFGDPLRVHTSFFYQLAYLASKLLGIDGSWFAYQLIYALLWLARGILCYEIVRRLVPQAPMFAYLAGALAIFHGADHTLNWVGQMNQFGFIFWMLLSFLMILNGLQASNVLRATVWATFGAISSYLSLWSYEAQLPVMLVAPWLLAFWTRTTRSRLVVILIALLPAAVFIALNTYRYYRGGGGDYQVSVLRADMTVYNLFADLLFNLKYAVEFWHWAELMPEKYAHQPFVVAPLFAAAAFALGGGLLARATRTAVALPKAGQLSLLLFGGGLLLCASFPAYLILNSSRWLWRTQMLGSPFAALVMTTTIGLAAALLSWPINRYRRLAQCSLILISGAIIGFYGAQASARIASFHFDTWERARETVVGVLRVAPQVAPNTIIVLVDVPPRTDSGAGDPFGDNSWFDTAMKLSYPAANATGYYFLEGGKPSPNNRFVEQIDTGHVNRLLVMRWRPEAQFQLLSQIPDELKLGAATRNEYQPERLIVSNVPSREANNRYRRFVAPWLAGR